MYSKSTVYTFIIIHIYNVYEHFLLLVLFSTLHSAAPAGHGMDPLLHNMCCVRVLSVASRVGVEPVGTAIATNQV